jgi:YD repeat-containing protein
MRSADPSNSTRADATSCASPTLAKTSSGRLKAATRIVSLSCLLLVAAVTGAGQITYEYDELGRLKAVTSAGGGTLTYVYDANGNRTFMQSAPQQACGTVSAFSLDSVSLQLYPGEQTAIAFSHNLDDSVSGSMAWTKSAALSVRLEYRIDFGTSGRSAGTPDVGWTLYQLYGASVSNATLDYTVGPIATNKVPSDRHNSTSTGFNPNDYAKLHLRMRLEDSQGLLCAWRYVQPVWLYFRT